MIAFMMSNNLAGGRGFFIVRPDREESLEDAWMLAELGRPIFLARGAVRDFLPAFENWVARSHERNGA